MMMDIPVSEAGSFHSLHQHILGLAAARAANEHALCVALLAAQRDGGWRRLGLATFVEYAERFAGLTPRQTEDRLRVGLALQRLPDLGAALAAGRLPFTAVRELCRVVEPGTERCWLDRTAHLSVGDIQKLVSGRQPGDLPDDPARAQRHRLSFEVGAEVYALFRDAQRRLRADGNASLSDEDLLRAMARSVLDGPADDGRSPYQIAMTACPTCCAATQDGAGEPIVVDETAMETAFCDAQLMDAHGHAKQTVPPTTRRLVIRRQHGRCAIPGCRLGIDEVHHIQFRSEGGTHHESNLLGLCSSHHAAVHRGTLSIQGTWSSGITVTHADGTRYGAADDPRTASLLSDVHQALTRMGFKDREARGRVAAVRTHVGGLGSFDSALRAALAAVPVARTSWPDGARRGPEPAHSASLARPDREAITAWEICMG